MYAAMIQIGPKRVRLKKKKAAAATIWARAPGCGRFRCVHAGAGDWRSCGVGAAGHVTSAVICVRSCLSSYESSSAPATRFATQSRASPPPRWTISLHILLAISLAAGFLPPSCSAATLLKCLTRHLNRRQRPSRILLIGISIIAPSLPSSSPPPSRLPSSSSASRLTRLTRYLARHRRLARHPSR